MKIIPNNINIICLKKLLARWDIIRASGYYDQPIQHEGDWILWFPVEIPYPEAYVYIGHLDNSQLLTYEER
jgi:hypothetical protein